MKIVRTSSGVSSARNAHGLCTHVLRHDILTCDIYEIYRFDYELAMHLYSTLHIYLYLYAPEINTFTIVCAMCANLA